MNNQLTAAVKTEKCSLTPAAAWKLWHQLIDLTNCLWDAFEQVLSCGTRLQAVTISL